MRIGLFGGSFNPVHVGHIKTAEYALHERSLDKIIFIPAFISPLKTSHSFIAPRHRLNMIRLALQGKAQFDLSDIEIRREGISYTIDTIDYFRKEYRYIDLIIGMDNLIVFDQWYKPDDLITKVNLIILSRGDESGFKKNKYFEKAIFLNSPKIKISSSEIRRKIKQSESIKGLVPEEVEKYIINNKLYKD
ncbi:MAG: nicotinate (nicotinamide) nucleotide adenylyltransferase [Ignavibacteriaceae bacterium]|nr:nicotinate (nicotinamide) nucleotide adenylyltransferase [Ignavibacteriaceae bacterium]